MFKNAKKLIVAGFIGGWREIWKLYLVFVYALFAGLGLYIGGAAAYALLAVK